MFSLLEEDQISKGLLSDIRAFQENHPVPELLAPRIPVPHYVYYGREVWEDAVSAMLCGENLLLVGSKATGKNVLAENLASIFGRPAWNVSFHAINPSELTRNHLHLTHLPTVTLESIDEAPSPISKILFEEPHPYLEKLMRYLDTQPWRSEYELVPSSDYLLEMTAKGANKGDMVRQLAHILGKNPRHVYCVGDHANDMSMLRFSHIPFAPANALDCVKAIPGTHVLPDSRQDTIAALIGVLDKLYEGV